MKIKDLLNPPYEGSPPPPPPTATPAEGTANPTAQNQNAETEKALAEITIILQRMENDKDLEEAIERLSPARLQQLTPDVSDDGSVADDNTKTVQDFWKSVTKVSEVTGVAAPDHTAVPSTTSSPGPVTIFSTNDAARVLSGLNNSSARQQFDFKDGKVVPADDATTKKKGKPYRLVSGFLDPNYGERKMTNLIIRRAPIGRFDDLYSSSSSYICPDNVLEARRQAVTHKISQIAKRGRTHLSELDAPEKILFIDAGNGHLLFDLARQYPQAEIIAVNHELHSTSDPITPPNIFFRTANLTYPFTSFDPSAPQSYDLILLSSSVLRYYPHSLPNLLSQCHSSLRPGGYLEIHESRDTVMSAWSLRAPAHVALQTALAIISPETEAGKLMGPNCRATLRQAGFVDVKSKFVKVPSNPHVVAGGKMADKLTEDEKTAVLLGELVRENAFENKLLEKLGERVFQGGLGWGEERAEDWVTEMACEMEDDGIVGYMPMYYTWGRKPTLAKGKGKADRVDVPVQQVNTVAGGGPGMYHLGTTVEGWNLYSKNRSASLRDFVTQNQGSTR
ncbi:hypothetical protein GE09DRAFT_1288784 [Coniochaeta sp. 2T2.1]|nr:hypothetical protein GE09DRAFT_1288784 [Coniochaeta sp. 2T2.1]